MIKCLKCGQEKEPHSTEPHLCVDCVKVENNRLSFYRQHNFNWLDKAKEIDIEPWQRQPDETDREWQVWLAYRDAYPSKKPTYSEIAEKLGTTINVVKKVGQRWTFPARLQLWAKYVDALTLRKRQEEIQNMNKEYVDIAAMLRNKLKVAIENINPASLEPSDINSLFKTAEGIERKARLDETVVTPVALEDDNPALKKAPTKTEDLSEILQILSAAGVLNAQQIGVRKTTTTEVIVSE